MIDMTQNDVHTFKEWCDENGFEDVFHDKFNSQHFEMAMIAFHEARAGACKPKEERMQVSLSGKGFKRMDLLCAKFLKESI